MRHKLMTTVVCDGVSIACDTRRAADGGEVDPFAIEPKFWTRNGVIFAACGLSLWPDAFMDWYGTQNDYPMLSGEDGRSSEIVVYDKRRWRQYWGDTTFPERISSRWAIGTGAPYAKAALLCGKSAARCVAIALQLDCHSGGRILHVTLADLLANGEGAIKEYRNVVQKLGKSDWSAVAIPARISQGRRARGPKRSAQKADQS